MSSENRVRKTLSSLCAPRISTPKRSACRRKRSAKSAPVTPGPGLAQALDAAVPMTATHVVWWWVVEAFGSSGAGVLRLGA